MNKYTQPSKSTVVTILAFICAAMMMSFYLYNYSQKSGQPVSVSDNSTLLPAPRDINEFSLVTVSGQPFTKKDLLGHWSLLFFGFAHCPAICPTTLSMLNKAYPELRQAYSDIRIIFISLDPDRDNPVALAQYVSAFNTSFWGISGKKEELSKLQRQLGIYSQRDATADDTYTLQHTSSILLVNPKAQWVGNFKYGMSAETFIKEFNATMQQLKKY